MARTQIGARQHVILSKLQMERLKKLAAKTSITVSEHIRRAVDHYFIKIVDDHVRSRK